MSVEAEIDAPTRREKWLAALGLRPREQPRVAAGLRVYTVGDIHGCNAVLARLHEKIEADAAGFSGEKMIVYLGDYVDRGPDSRGVIERLIGAVPEGFKARFVRGNHDAAVLEFLENAESYRAWRGFGAPETLVSYGVRPPLFDSLDKFEEARTAFAAALPPAHLAFLRRLEMTVSYGDYVFVHAGVRPGIPMARQSEQDLLWIRDEFLMSGARHEKIVVHGHSPVSAPQRLHNRIALDTGVYATGVLSCAVLESTHCRFIQAGID